MATKTNAADTRHYAVQILASRSAIESHTDGKVGVIEPSSLRALRFFVASVDRTRWITRVALVRHEGKHLGMVFAKELKYGGIPTGILYSDSTLCPTIVSAMEDRELVLEKGVGALLARAGCVGMRFVIGPDEDRLFARIAARLDVKFHARDFQNHSILELPPHYSSFLEAIGKRSRRNLRYYRERFENAGGQWIEHISAPEFSAAAEYLMNRCTLRHRRRRIERTLAMVTAAEAPIRMGLRGKEGQWLSIVGGWHDADLAVICFQLNDDKGHPQMSLCTVLRGYLIEDAISRNVRAIAFWAGASGQLAPYCRVVPAVCVHLDSNKFLWRTLRRLLTGMAGLYPSRFRRAIEWIAADAK